MSTATTACVPSALTTTIAWRQRRIGCEGTTKPLVQAKFSGETGDQRVETVAGHDLALARR